MSRKENSNSSFLLNSSPANLGSLHKEVETNMRNGKNQHCPDDDGGSTSVSFMLEEPRSSLKEGFNIEVITYLFDVNYWGNNVKLVMHQISVDKIENPCY